MKVSKSRIDISGKSFGRWTVRSYAGGSKWVCLCECGIVGEVYGDYLRRGLSKSCGCLSADLTSRRFLKHGHAKVGHNTPEYRAWASARERCTNSKKKNWHRYGGRGIRMCEQWMDSFEEFLKYVGPRPSQKHSLDRYPDNDGNYEPGNVRWATSAQQRANQSTGAAKRPDVQLRC